MIKTIKFSIFFLFCLTNISNASGNIAFIDINFIFKNSNAGKDLHIQLSDKQSELQLEIKKYKNLIEDQKTDILSQKNVLSVEEYNKKIKSLDEEIIKINTTVSNKQSEFVLFQNKIESNFSNKLNLIIEEYSTKNSIDIIFKKENLLMAKKSLDITQEIFKLFNNSVQKIDLK